MRKKHNPTESQTKTLYHLIGSINYSTDLKDILQKRAIALHFFPHKAWNIEVVKMDKSDELYHLY